MRLFILRLIAVSILCVDISLALNVSKKKQINFLIDQIYDRSTFVSDLTNSTIDNINVSSQKELSIIARNKEKRKAIRILAKLKNETKNIFNEMHEDKLSWIYEQFNKNKALGKYFAMVKIMEYTFPFDIATYFLKFNTVLEVHVVSKIEETYLDIINFVPHESSYEEWAKEINEIRKSYISTPCIITASIIKAYTTQFCLSKVKSFLSNLTIEEQEKFIEVLMTVHTFK